MNLYEVLESPYAVARWNWNLQSPNAWDGQFMLGDKEYKVNIKKTDEGAYIVKLSYIFYDKNGKSLTQQNAGDRTYALTTLVHMVNEFAHHMNPKILVIHPGDWRLKSAYKDRFSKMFAGWKIALLKDNTIKITNQIENY